MTESLDKSRRAVFLALAALALWSSVAALSLKLRAIPPFLLVGISLTLGALVGARGLRLRGLTPGVLALGVYGLFTYHFCLFTALRLAPPVETNLLNYLWPLLIVLLSPLIVKGTALRPRHVLGAFLGFFGAALLVAGSGRLGFPAGALAGYALAVAGAVIWSTYSLLTKRFGGFPTSTVSVFCLVAGVLSFLCHLAFEPRYAPTMAEAPYLLFMGLGPMGASFYLWDRALKDGDPRVIGTLAYLTPLGSTALIAMLGLGRLTITSAAAGALIIAGAFIGGR